MYTPAHKKPKHFDYDLIVIGTGSGGNVAAHTAVKYGKRVAMVEMERLGGECPNFGCVPTKALLQAAETYKTAQEAQQYGIYVKAEYKYPEVKAWKELVVARTGTEEGSSAYKHEGIDIFRGHAHFLDPWTVRLGDGKRHTARNFLVATGTRPVTPPIPGLKEACFISYRQAIELEQPPKSLFVIGGGAIGCEFAELFSTFGAKVHIADIAPHLLPPEDPEAGELLKAVFENKGVDVYLNTFVTRVSVEKGKKVVHYKQGETSHTVSVDEIFVAAGMAPNTDLGLENAGVTYNKHGIMTNRFMQTSTKHIYAAGDVVGPYGFTHTAAYQSRVAAHNMFSARSGKVATDYHAVPRCVFVDPEIANVGLTEKQLVEKGVRFVTAAVPINMIGRSNTTNMDTGFVKIIATDRSRKLLGASIVAPRAGEMIHELTLAIQHNMTAHAVASTIHAFPTWSEAVRLACHKLAVAK